MDGDFLATPLKPLSRHELTEHFKLYVKTKRNECGQRAPPRPRGALRIASYNIHFHSPYSHKGADEGSEAIRNVINNELDADVVCLQEVVKPHVFDKFPHVATFMVSSLGNAIISKFPLKDVCKYKYSAQDYDDRGVIAATVVHPLGDFRLFNTHLDAFDNTDRLRFEQASEIPTILERDSAAVSFEGPILLMGDFNALHRASYLDDNHWKWINEQDSSRRVTPMTLAMDTLLSNGAWQDMFVANPPPVTTWSMRRIDYIMQKTRRELNPKFLWSTWVHFTVASDHLPVGIDITLAAT